MSGSTPRTIPASSGWSSVGTDVGILMQVQADSMADKRDWRQIEFGKLLEVDLVHSLGRCTGLGDVEQQMLAGGEVGPDAFRLRRRGTDGRCSAHAGMIAGDHREDFDAA